MKFRRLQLQAGSSRKPIAQDWQCATEINIKAALKLATALTLIAYVHFRRGMPPAKKLVLKNELRNAIQARGEPQADGVSLHVVLRRLK